MIAPTQLVQKPWLVKSGGNIMGPFSSREIEERLLSKEMVALDEIIFNFGRWHYVRDEIAFERVLTELRIRSGGSAESTQTHTKTDSLTKTMTLTDTEKIGDTPVSAIPAAPPPQEVRAPTSAPPVRTYGMAGDRQVEEEVGRRSIPTTLWVVALIAAAIVFGYSRKITKHAGGRSDDEEFSYQIGEGSIALKRGDRDAAKLSFSKALEIKQDSTETALKLAPLLITDHETVQAKRILDRILTIDKNIEIRALALTGLALTAIQDGHLDIAEKELAKAAKLDKSHPIVAYNLGVLHYLKRDAKKASHYFGVAAASSPTPGIALMMAGESALLPRDKDGAEVLKEASAQLTRYLTTSGWDYRQELHILRARIEAASNREAEAIREVDAALDIDPSLTSDFIHDEMYYTAPVGWDRIVEWVRFIQNKVGNRPRFEALLGYCLFRGREKHEGKSHVDDALKQSPKDPLILAINSYISRNLGHEDEAEANLNMALETEGPMLPWLLKARACEKRSDRNCSRDAFGKILKVRANDLVALVSLGRLAYQSGNMGEARKYLGDVPASSSHYGPFMRLGHDLASKGGAP